MGSDLYTHTKMAKAVKTSPVNQVLNGRSQRIDQKEVERNCSKIVSEECLKKSNSCPDNHNVLLKDENKTVIW